MEILSFFLGVMYTFPFNMALVCVGILVLLFSDMAKPLREKLYLLLKGKPEELVKSDDIVAIKINETLKPIPTIEQNRDIGGQQLTYVEESQKVEKHSVIETKKQLAQVKQIEQIPLFRPYPIWVQVYFKKDPSKLYCYLKGDIKDLKVGDKVIVYAKNKKGKPRRKIVTISYISNGTEPLLIKKASPITFKIRGRYMATKNGNCYHNFWCKCTENVTEKDVIWFQSRADAEKRGYRKCKKC